MAKIAFIIHGWQGNPKGGWKPWLRTQLERRGWKVIVPAMPNPDYPKQEEWVGHISHLVRILNGPGEDFYLVGHSLGVTAILRYLETLDKEVGGAVLVAGPVEYNGIKELENFFLKPFDWPAIRSHCKKIVAIQSDNDPYIPLKHGAIYKEKLGAELVIKKDMGHFSGDEGCTELPAALEAILKISE